MGNVYFNVTLYMALCMISIPTQDWSPQAILGALEAIRGHKSAHSFATGPVTVEPGEPSEQGSPVKIQTQEPFFSVWSKHSHT